MLHNLKDFNLGKALRTSAARQSLTGIEDEVSEAGREELKRFGSKEPGAGFYIPNQVLRSLVQKRGYVYQPEIAANTAVVSENGILAQLGTTLFDELVNPLIVKHRKFPSSQFLADGVAYVDDAVSETTDRVEPTNRIQGSFILPNSYLVQAQTSEDLVLTIIESIEAETARVIFEQILALPALTGFDSAAVAKALAWSDITALKNAVVSPRLRSPRFVTFGSLYGT